MEAGQESSDDKVSGSILHYIKEILLKVLRKYFFWECLYSVRRAVTCLLTVPIVKEFRRSSLTSMEVISLGPVLCNGWQRVRFVMTQPVPDGSFGEDLIIKKPNSLKA